MISGCTIGIAISFTDTGLVIQGNKIGTDITGTAAIPNSVAGILILFTLALTWFAVIAGLSAKSVDGVSAFSYPLIFLPFISSAFVLTETMPGPVRAFAEHQSVTPIVNGIRELYTRQPVSTDLWIGLAWCLGILIAAYALAMISYRRKSHP